MNATSSQQVSHKKVSFYYIPVHMPTAEQVMIHEKTAGEHRERRLVIHVLARSGTFGFV